MKGGEAAFLADTRTQDAILRCLEVVGEAAKRLSPEFRSSHPRVPWKAMAGFREVAIHQYDRVDLALVWRAVERDVPAVLAEVESLLRQLGERR